MTPYFSTLATGGTAFSIIEMWKTMDGKLWSREDQKVKLGHVSFAIILNRYLNRVISLAMGWDISGLEII